MPSPAIGGVLHQRFLPDQSRFTSDSDQELILVNFINCPKLGSLEEIADLVKIEG